MSTRTKTIAVTRKEWEILEIVKSTGACNCDEVATLLKAGFIDTMRSMHDMADRGLLVRKAHGTTGIYSLSAGPDAWQDRCAIVDEQ